MKGKNTGKMRDFNENDAQRIATEWHQNITEESWTEKNGRNVTRDHKTWRSMRWLRCWCQECVTNKRFCFWGQRPTTRGANYSKARAIYKIWIFYIFRIFVFRPFQFPSENYALWMRHEVNVKKRKEIEREIETKSGTCKSRKDVTANLKIER